MFRSCISLSLLLAMFLVSVSSFLFSPINNHFSYTDGDAKVSKERAAILISVIGITNTIGRLLFGYVSDQITRSGEFLGVRMTCLGLNNISVLIAGVLVCAIPFCTTYTSILINSVFFGLFICKFFFRDLFLNFKILNLYFFPDLQLPISV